MTVVLPSKFPKAYIARLRQIVSNEDLDCILAAYDSSRDAAFRVNTLKSNANEIEQALTERGVRFSRFEGLSDAYMVPSEDEYRLKGSQAFYDGKIYVQGISSQIPAHFLSLSAGMRVLDMCAAPGSKTTQIAALLGNTGSVVALEKSPIRFDKLVHNVNLQGGSCVEVIRAEALSYLAGNSEAFDAILLDAPCSAEGRIRLEDEKSYGFWSMDNIAKKAELQLSLFEAAISRLQVGGTLVYSTCTLAPEENESVVTRILAKHPELSLETVSLDISEARPGIISFQDEKFHPDIAKTLRILPSSRMEGFYLAKIRKSA